MMQRYGREMWLTVIALGLMLATAGCAGSPSSDSADDQKAKNGHTAVEAGLPPVVHRAGETDHGFPDEAPVEMRTLKNPIGKAIGSDIEKGLALYQVNCQRCHGVRGDGMGPDGEGLSPAPADLTGSHFTMMSDQVVYYILETGIEGSEMPSWADIPSLDRWRLIHYLRTLAPSEADEPEAHGMHEPE